jgi:hypothetical protein
MSVNAMTAEIIIDDPNNLGEVTARLVEEGFEVEFLDDWIDGGGSNVCWLLADIRTTITEEEFFAWVGAIVAPLGDVIEAGLCSPEQRAAWRIKDLDR